MNQENRRDQFDGKSAAGADGGGGHGAHEEAGLSFRGLPGRWFHKIRNLAFVVVSDCLIQRPLNLRWVDFVTGLYLAAFKPVHVAGARRGRGFRPMGFSAGQDLLAFANGDFSACAGPVIHSRESSGYRRAIFQASRDAGVLRGVLDGAPVKSLAPGKLRIILLDGADWRAVRPWLNAGHSGVIAVSGNSAMPRPEDIPPDFSCIRVWRIARGREGLDFENVRTLARAIIDDVAKKFASTGMGEWISRFVLPLENRLFMELTDSIAIARDARRAAGSKADGETIILVEGTRRADHLAAVLAKSAAGRQVLVLSGSHNLTVRVDFARRYGLVDWRKICAKKYDTSLPGEKLLANVVHAQKYRFGFPRFAGRVVLTFEFKSKKEFRYLPTAKALVRHMAGRKKLTLLLQENIRRMWYSPFSPGFYIRHAASLWFVHARSPLTFRLDPVAAGWEAILAQSVEETMAAQRDEISPEFLAIVQNSVMVFSGRYLIGTLAFGRKLEGLFKRSPPQAVVALPGLKSMTMVVAAAARNAGIPTLDVQTLLIGSNGRDCRPVCEYMACMDSYQKQLYAERFGFRPENIFLAGHMEMTRWRRQAQEIRKRLKKEAASDSKMVVFAAQPIAGETAMALEKLVAAADTRTDVKVIVFAHPDDSEAMKNQYRQIAAAAKNPASVTISRRRLREEDVLKSSLVVTINSNVGYRAGILGCNVMTIESLIGRQTIDLARLGLSIGVDEQDEVTRVFNELLDHGPAFERLQATQRAFLDQNRHLESGDAIELIAGFVEKLGAGSPGRN